jgi:multidrug resistance efflux pump
MAARTVTLAAAALLACGSHDDGHLLLTGQLEADDVRVGSLTGGRVVQVLAREGDQVAAGDSLLLFDCARLLAGRDEAGAAVVRAAARLREARAGYMREEIAEARARHRSLVAQAEQAARQLTRVQGLQAAGLASPQELEEAESAAESAREEADAMAERVRRLERGTRSEEIASTEAEHAAALARLAAFEAEVRECAVIAPRAGRIETLDLRPGDLLAAGAAVAVILNPDSLWVRVYVPEDRLGWVRPGQTVTLRVDSFPGRTYSGRVRTVGHEPEFTPRNAQTPDERALQVFPVRVDLAGSADGLRPGMAADVTVPAPR